MAGFTGTKTQEDIKKNEENKKKKIDEKKNTVSDKDKEMFSLSYDEAKSKYGQGVGNNKYFMSKSDFEKRQKELGSEQPKKEQSLVANRFGEKKGKTWNDVVTENGNDPEKIMNWLNSNPDYKAGELTKKGMSEFGYKQDENGKWGKNDSITNDKVIDELDNITTENKEAKNLVDLVTNPETGDVDEEKAKGAVSEYEKRLVEIGAATYDKDGNFVLTNVNAKGWEDWATVLSAGLSVLGLAFGVPIIPINFRKITNKDERDAKIRELQQQYMSIEAGNAGKVKDVESSAEAGKFAKNNKEDIDAYSEYTENVGGYKAKSDIDTSSEKELIETRTDAQIRADEAQFQRDMKRLKSDQDFQLKYAALQQQYGKEMAELQSSLSTGSAIDVMKYQKSGFLKDLQDMGMSFSDIASYTAAQNGISPADKNWNRVNMTVDMVNKTVGTGVDAFATVSTGGLNKLGD